MNWLDYFRTGLTLAMAGIFAVWAYALHRSNKHEARKVEAEVKTLVMMEQGVEGLKQAALAALWLRHFRYKSDDEAPPMHVKCIDCGESVGTCQKPEEILDLAGEHVLAKFEEVVRNVQTLAPESVK